MKFSTILIFPFIFIWLLPSPGFSTGTKSAHTPESCQQFVQDFYDWYLPMALNGKSDSLKVALKERRESFEPELWRALKDDCDAQEKAHEIVGLDWDPILSSQDPDPKYKAEKGRFSNSECLVDIKFGTEEKMREGSSITAHLKYLKNQWCFSNFYYTDSSSPKTHDLLSDLKTLSESRKK